MSSTSPDLGGGPAVEAQGLTMNYGSMNALDDVSFSIGKGEVIGLLGPNGAGKTTTIEILEGFRAPSAGEARVLGVRPLEGDEAWRARIGVVLQSWRDHGRWPVRRLLTHFSRFYRAFSTPKRPKPKPVDTLLERVGLTKHANKRVDTLSGGLRRRLDVAVGIVGNPDVLFLDEPTTGFDPDARQEFHTLLRDLAEQDGMTILMTTHDLQEAERLSDRIMILAAGRIVAQGAKEELGASVVQEDEVRWSVEGRHHVRSVTDSTGFVRQLFAEHGDRLADLQVHKATLEDIYLAMVRRHEAGDTGLAVTEFMKEAE